MSLGPADLVLAVVGALKARRGPGPPLPLLLAIGADEVHLWWFRSSGHRSAAPVMFFAVLQEGRWPPGPA